MKKSFHVTGIILLIIVTIFFVTLFYISQKTNRTFFYFPKVFYTAIKQNNIPDYFNLMILGLDRRHDWLEKTESTDTIIFSQVNFYQNIIHLFSFPRDLWDYYTNTKINQIYPLSLDKSNSLEKYSYISDSFASISGQPISRILILSTDNLKQLADILGGVDLYLENGFIDKKYPNEAYIQNPNSGAPIYKTVEFKSGFNHLDGSNITEFVRSRKSTETADSGGTDLGRIERQQQLINALIDKLRNSLVQKPMLIFDLYNYWGSLEHNFNDQELLSYFLKHGLNIKNIAITRHPIISGEDPKNLLYHPAKFINSQWVFIPQDEKYKSFQEFISQSLVSP